MVNDFIAFMPNKRNLTIGLLDGSDCNITVALNLSTEIYCKIISGVSALNSVNDNEKLDIVIDLVYEILNSYHTYDTEIKFVDYKSKEWITKNVPMQNMMDIITVVMQEINHILENDCFNIPDVHVTTISQIDWLQLGIDILTGIGNGILSLLGGMDWFI